MRLAHATATVAMTCVLTGLVLAAQSSSKQFTVELPSDPLVPSEADCQAVDKQYGEIISGLGGRLNTCQANNIKAANAISPRCERAPTSGLYVFTCITKAGCVGLKDAVFYVIEERDNARNRCQSRRRLQEEALRAVQAALVPSTPRSPMESSAVDNVREVGKIAFNEDSLQGRVFDQSMRDIGLVQERILSELDEALASMRRETAPAQRAVAVSRVHAAMATARQDAVTAPLAEEKYRHFLEIEQPVGSRSTPPNKGSVTDVLIAVRDSVAGGTRQTTDETQSAAPMPFARLGVSAVDLDTGVSLRDVTMLGPAYTGGLRVGDVIMHFNGRPIDTALTLDQVVSRIRPGTVVVVGVRRASGNRILLLTVK